MMTVRDTVRWKTWAEKLRQRMMVDLTPQVTISVTDIINDTATEKSPNTLRSTRFWNACREGQGSSDTLAKAGFELGFEPNTDGEVDNVTFQLNETWMAIMQQVLDRRTVSRTQD